MLTPAQQKVYRFIQHFIAQKHFAPSLSEIAKGLGLQAKSSISRHVHALVDAGLISLDDVNHRQIRFNPSPLNELSVPLLGYIAAGKPIEAIAHNDTFNLQDMLPKQPHYALTVKGNSMCEDGILDGDIILCEQRIQATNGEIVVALIDGDETTLKHYYQNKNGTITLKPANITLKPITYKANRIQIQGVFVGLVRMCRK